MEEEGGKKGTFRSEAEKCCTEKIKVGLNTSILVIFSPFNWRYSVLFLFLPILCTAFGSQVCFEVLDCLHRLSAYPEDGSLLSAMERILPGNICIAGRQKLVGKAIGTCNSCSDVAGGHAETTSKPGLLLLLKLYGNEEGGILVYD